MSTSTHPQPSPFGRDQGYADRGLFEGGREKLFALAQGLLGASAFRDVLRHHHDADHAAVLVAIRNLVGSNPTLAAIAIKERLFDSKRRRHLAAVKEGGARRVAEKHHGRAQDARTRRPSRRQWAASDSARCRQPGLWPHSPLAHASPNGIEIAKGQALWMVRGSNAA